MSYKKVHIWWEGDNIEVSFNDNQCTVKSTENSRLTVKVDEDGGVCGFTICDVPTMKDGYINVDLASTKEPRKVNVWWDAEGGFLEVIWKIREGYFELTEDRRLNVKRAFEDGQVLGFHVFGIKKLKERGKSLEEELLPGEPETAYSRNQS
jgi:hypothetical protein